MCSHVVRPGARFALCAQNLHHHIDSKLQILITIMEPLPNHGKSPMMLTVKRTLEAGVLHAI